MLRTTTQPHTTQSRNTAGCFVVGLTECQSRSLDIGPAEDCDPLASLIFKGQAVQIVTARPFETSRTVYSKTQRHILHELNRHVTTRVHISTYTLYFTQSITSQDCESRNSEIHRDGLRLRKCLANCAARLLDTRPTAILVRSKNCEVVWWWCYLKRTKIKP